MGFLKVYGLFIILPVIVIMMIGAVIENAIKKRTGVLYQVTELLFGLSVFCLIMGAIYCLAIGFEMLYDHHGWICLCIFITIVFVAYVLIIKHQLPKTPNKPKQMLSDENKQTLSKAFSLPDRKENSSKAAKQVKAAVYLAKVLTLMKKKSNENKKS